MTKICDKALIEKTLREGGSITWRSIWGYVVLKNKEGEDLGHCRFDTYLNLDFTNKSIFGMKYDLFADEVFYLVDTKAPNIWRRLRFVTKQ